MQPTCPDHRDAVPGRDHCHRCAALALWFAVPADTRDEIDGHLRRRSVVAAVRALRGTTSGGPVSALHRALDAVLERRQWLQDRGEVTPLPAVPSLEEMLATVAAAGAPPVAVEVCWDGDPFGWIADLVVVVQRPSFHHRRYDEVSLWAYRDGTAAERGTALADRLGVPFHFEQPDEPGLDLPRWWDRATPRR
jgi:hypothetical protein